MTNSKLFKQAHSLTKQTIKQGDSYRYTFGQCLKQIQSELGKHTQTVYSMNAEPMTITTYSKARKINKSVALIGDYNRVKQCNKVRPQIDFTSYLPIIIMLALLTTLAIIL